MLTFKNKTTGLVVEVTEEFANQVLRPQGKYEEIKEVKEASVEKTITNVTKKKVTKKKVKKKASK